MLVIVCPKVPTPCHGCPQQFKPLLEPLKMKQQEPYIPSILAVDDKPGNLDILVEHFKSDTVQLTVALNGEDALNLAAQILPDLILLDIMMPGIDGYEVCRRLKANVVTKDIPIIFVTAMGESVNEEIGLSLGAIDYVSKPYVVPVLKARVRNHLELKRKTDLLTQLVCLDGLTGIPNRRHFDKMLGNEWKRCLRAKQPLSLIMIDVDHFKLFNDHYGHGLGDDCLKQVAISLGNTIKRPEDMVARYGGEEFVVILPGVNGQVALEIGERLRNSVLALEIPHVLSSTNDIITISLGVTSVLPAAHLSPEKALKVADEQLYRAKGNGRNRCAFNK